MSAFPQTRGQRYRQLERPVLTIQDHHQPLISPTTCEKNARKGGSLCVAVVSHQPVAAIR